MQEKVLQLPVQAAISSKIQDYLQLTKFRLSSLVVFSAALGFVIGSGGNFSWPKLILFAFGGFLVTGASNGFNQVMERDYDKMMDRTADRPLPAGRMSVREATLICLIMGIVGTIILWVYMNPVCGFIGLMSLLIYLFVYTPSKRVTPFSVLIGAIPGAFPPLLGWVAARNEIGYEALLLYGIQFIWQFPHFWAIAWVLHDDYKKAGFMMLPAGGRTRRSAFQTFVYSVALVPMAMLPQIFGLVGTLTTVCMMACGVLFAFQALQLYKTLEVKAAQKLMFGSFIYLPVVQLIWMISRII